MQLRYGNLISLGGVQLTDEGRAPISEDRDERSVVVDLASGKKRKFIKGVRKTWSISWEMVPLNASHTIDGFGGRDEIKALAAGAGTLTFTLRDADGSVDSYTVFVSEYSENTQFRRGEGSRYQISLGLEEQG